MLALLLAFGLVPLIVPTLTRLLGVRVFPLVALVPVAAFVYTLLQGPTVMAGTASVEVLPWIPQLHVELSVRVDTLSWLLALIVTGIGALVILYCTRYFTDSEEGLGRFAAVLLAFTGTMYGLVIADACRVQR